MKKILLKIFSISFCFIALKLSAKEIDYNVLMLAENFPLYISGNNYSLYKKSGFELRYLPVKNFFKYTPGCYISCIKKNSGLYLVRNNFYQNGVIRISGYYKDNKCIAQGYNDSSYINNINFKKLCTQEHPHNCFGDGCEIDETTMDLFKKYDDGLKDEKPDSSEKQINKYNDPYGDYPNKIKSNSDDQF